MNIFQPTKIRVLYSKGIDFWSFFLGGRHTDTRYEIQRVKTTDSIFLLGSKKKVLKLGDKCRYRYTRNDTRETIHEKRYTIHDTRYTIHDTRYKIQDTRYTTRDTRYTIQDTVHTVHTVHTAIQISFTSVCSILPQNLCWLSEEYVYSRVLHYLKIEFFFCCCVKWKRTILNNILFHSSLKKDPILCSIRR